MKVGFSCHLWTCLLPHPDGRPSEGSDEGGAGLEAEGHSSERTCAEPPEGVELSYQLVEWEWQIPTARLAALP